jgi:hypothetical protein
VRALDCECDQHLEAADEYRDHPDAGLSDEQVSGIVEQGAYDYIGAVAGVHATPAFETAKITVSEKNWASGSKKCCSGPVNACFRVASTVIVGESF